VAVAHQARWEITRRKIIDAALDLYDEIGYAATGMGDIIERAKITKGALYYHFDSKEAVAADIVTRGGERILDTFLSVCEASAPAIENLICSSFALADHMARDKVARAAHRLAHTLGPGIEAATVVNRTWLAAVGTQLRRVDEEGDLRPDVDPDVAAEVIMAASIGTTLMSVEAPNSGDLPVRLLRMWEVLLPAIVPEQSLEYLRQFLGRQPLRRTKPTTSAR
jgi:AcrR family transcriptional regulator